MQIIDTHMEGLKVIIPKIWEDGRGYFFESYHNGKFKQAGINSVFIQDNEAKSTYGVVRGLHFQKGIHAQAKLVSVKHGEVLDVVVDCRPNSSTLGKVFSVILNDIGKKQLYIPAGFAHGYSVLTPTAVFHYKCSALYHPSSEGGIHPEDEDLDIDWMIPLADRIISEKDKNLPSFSIVMSQNHFNVENL